LFDKDNSGQVSVTELQSVMATLGHPQTAAEMEEIMLAIDQDGSGEVMKQMHFA
jgi:Ca2+-binding EF-hand superfamily protein